MTELTEAQKTLAEVVLAHELAEYSWGVDGCECGHRDTDNHHIHVALEIDKALGGLGPIYATGGSGKRLIAWTSYGWEPVTE